MKITLHMRSEVSDKSLFGGSEYILTYCLMDTYTEPFYLQNEFYGIFFLFLLRIYPKIFSILEFAKL